MKLENLLEKITPLPWSTPHFALSQEHWDKLPTPVAFKNQKSRCDCGFMLCDSLMGAIATVHKGDKENEGDDPIGEAADANALYLAHSANVLPELVAAIKAHSAAVLAYDIANADYKTFGESKYRRRLEMASLNQSKACQELKDAIARAENISF